MSWSPRSRRSSAITTTSGWSSRRAGSPGPADRRRRPDPSLAARVGAGRRRSLGRRRKVGRLEGGALEDVALADLEHDPEPVEDLLDEDRPGNDHWRTLRMETR